MTKILGYILATTGSIAILFFINYNGSTIPLKELWFVIGLFILLYGAYLILKSKFQSQFSPVHNQSKHIQVDRLKRIGEKVKVTLDNCEVKTRSFQEEIINDRFPSRIEIMDSFSSTGRNYKTTEIQQTYLVFEKKYGDTIYKFISQPTTQNNVMVKKYIDSNHGIDLYIDRKNPAIYYFDLPFL